MAESHAPASPLRFRAFISYSHHDEAWAVWLHKALETYRVPSRLVGQITPQGVIPPRLTPVFRDRDELPSSPDLNSKVAEALGQSENLIVVCSPHSATSRWVDEEVLAFKRLGRPDRIFCLIVGGEPGASAFPGREAEECFGKALRHALADDGTISERPAEPIAADARSGMDGRSNARLKLIAGLLGVGFDRLKQREQQRRLRRMTALAALALVVMLVTTTLAVLASIAQRNAEAAREEAQRRQAQTEDLLGFMLGDLHDKLKGVGRLDLMESVADKTITLFDESDTGKLTDGDLARQSQALVQIGQIRLDETKLDAAMTTFQSAYRRSAALASRHPNNGNHLFDRGQAEFWIGYVYWQRRELEPATTWLTRYRDTSQLLLKIDPANLDWQLEVTYGEHNLAVLALELGDFESAQRAFESELDQHKQIAATHPDGVEKAAHVADTTSWLGTVAEKRGDLVGAAARFRSQYASYVALHEAHPGDRRWQSARANAAELLAGVLGVTGRQDEAMALLADAGSTYETLVAFDPKNKNWVVSLASVRTRQAQAGVRVQASREAIAKTMAILENLLREDQEKGANIMKMVHRWMSRIQDLGAVQALQRSDVGTAERAARRAVQEAEKESTGPVTDDDSLSDRANALLTLGQVQKVQKPQEFPPAWNEAHELIAERASISRYWRLLEPWLRLSRFRGDEPEARAIEQKLHSMGYVAPRSSKT